MRPIANAHDLRIMNKSTADDIREKRQSLMRITISPIIWAAHFLASYITAAIWCAKYAGADGSLGGVRAAIGIFTLVALLGIGLNGWDGWRRHQYGWGTTSQDFDTPEDRHRFLGFATFLLAGLSAIAVIFVAIVVFYFEDCR